MTLVIAVKGEDFVVLGADSRGVVQSFSGTRVETNIVRKLSQLSKYVGILVAGDGELGHYLINEFKRKYTKTRKLGVSKIARLFSKFCKENFDFETMIKLARNNIPFPDVSFIIAGLDEKKYPRLLKLSSTYNFQLRESPTPYVVEGKIFIPLYKLEKEFVLKYDDEFKNSVQRSVELVAQIIYDTHRIDGDVGMPKWIARITPHGYEEIKEEHIRGLYSTWEQQIAREIIEK